MAISKGQLDIKSESDLVILGFEDQVKMLKDTQYQQEAVLKAQLFDILSDSTIDNDEKMSIKKPLLEELQNIKERHIRIRRTIFIGIYSLWELSLRTLSELKEQKSVNAEISNKGTTKEQESYARKCLNRIYAYNIPAKALDIDSYVRFLRNYMVHGKFPKDKLEQLCDFSANHPELYLNISADSCYISSYDGLLNLLTLIQDELNNAELSFCSSTDSF
jgi:hypothetical protein